MKKNPQKRLALLLALAMSLSVLAGCTAGQQNDTQPETPNNQDSNNQTLVVGTLNFDGKFSPFFYTNAYENDILSLVHTNLLTTDREGAVVLNGIKGEVRPYNGTDYTYSGIADCAITENADGTVFYNITLKEGIQFSDGTVMDIDDVIFSLYVPLDPSYDGIMTLYSLPIQGLDAYRQNNKPLSALLAELGEENTDFTLVTQAQQDAFWTAVNDALVPFAQEILDIQAELAGESVSQRAESLGYTLAPDATVKDFALAIGEKYGWDFSAMEAEAAETSLADRMDAAVYADFPATNVQTGDSAPNISGIQKTGDNSLRIVLTEPSATAIYQLATPIVPMHYYGEESLYDYENNMFGFTKGDLSDVKSVTTTPMGAGPYTFDSYKNATVTLTANEGYWKGCPKIRHIQFKEGQDADKVPGIVSGTLDITDPAFSTETAKAITGANGGVLTGEVITTNMVTNLGYGFVGINAKNVNVGGESGSEASRNLRKAIATVISVYRDVAVDSYYGGLANVINYPISDTSWAAPRVTDEGYRVAFSTAVDGSPIYTEGMTVEEKYAAANAAALDYFAAAGYTVEGGRITAAPEGASMHYEVLVGGGGTGDHPAFMALSMAADALAQIGFTLTVTDISNVAELTNAVNAGTAELYALAWNATADPDMYQIYHSEGGSNEKAYWIKDPDLDEMILMARASNDQAYRKTLYKECLDIVADWAVEIPMYQRQNVILFSSERINVDTITPDITTFWGWENDIELLEMN